MKTEDEFKKLEETFNEIQEILNDFISEEEDEEQEEVEELTFKDLEDNFRDSELNNKTVTLPIIQGWQCPSCKRVNAPTVLQCICYKHQPYNPLIQPWKNPYEGAFPNWPTQVYY